MPCFTRNSMNHTLAALRASPTLPQASGVVGARGYREDIQESIGPLGKNVGQSREGEGGCSGGGNPNYSRVNLSWSY